MSGIKWHQVCESENNTAFESTINIQQVALYTNECYKLEGYYKKLTQSELLNGQFFTLKRLIYSLGD